MKNYPLIQKIAKLLQAAADRVAAFAQKAEALPGKAPEILVLVVYAAAHLGMAVVHEPFFDEAEAWQIARCVSLRTLFLETTHYEGHPPLWHLILMPFAKAGAPYELSLSLVSLAFTGTAVLLILRYAPFPRLVRLLLPFTYFYFYQYGVISRVYCVMTLLLVLLAMAYSGRNEKPGRYTAVLILLCVTLAYGLVFAGGLAIVWLWEIWREKAWKQNGQVGREAGDGGGPARQERSDGQESRMEGARPVREIARGCVTDRRIWWLTVLLAAALVVIWMIMPRTDSYAISSAASGKSNNSFAVRLLYAFLVLPADVTLTDIYCDYQILLQASLPLSVLASGAVIGLLIWSLLLYYGRKKGMVLLLVLPYGLFALFSAAVYLSYHHIGIGLLWFCFWCWVCAGSGDDAAHAVRVSVHWEKRQGSRESLTGKAREISVDRADTERMARCAAILFGTLAMAVSLFWTGAACTLDICKNYAPGRKDAAFIREHHLDRYRMMSGWIEERDEEGNVVGADINMCDQAVNLAPYFEYNLFFNFNDGRDDRNYITHIRLSEAETLRHYEAWRQEELPRVLWMLPNLSAVYGDTLNWQDYVLVYRAPAEQVWKAGTDYKESSIWVRRELLEETGLGPLQVKP